MPNESLRPRAKNKYHVLRVLAGVHLRPCGNPVSTLLPPFQLQAKVVRRTLVAETTKKQGTAIKDALQHPRLKALSCPCRARCISLRSLSAEARKKRLNQALAATPQTRSSLLSLSLSLHLAPVSLLPLEGPCGGLDASKTSSIKAKKITRKLTDTAPIRFGEADMSTTTGQNKRKLTPKKHTHAHSS